MTKFRRLEPLAGAQRDASDPRALVWLSASAGTGKTHVLTARVLRLLLTGVRPETILCLTFTKAGAAEMADRVHARLAAWVRLREADLRKELFALGEPNDEAAVARARTLFADVLDAPGGGLRIQTIHAFCQTLLAGFPAEAGLAPGFRPLDARGEGVLARRVLAELLEDAQAGGDLGLIRDVQVLSRRLGEQAAEQYLMRCARAADAMAALGSREGIEPRVRTALDVPLGDVEQAIARACHDDAHDCMTLDAVLVANRAWGTSGGTSRAELIGRWRAEPERRAERLADLHLVWAKADGAPRSFAKGQAPQSDGYADMAMRLHEWTTGLLGLRARAELAALIAAGLRSGQAYALRYQAAKRATGAVDFDDLIRATVALLAQPGIGMWIRYKLDRATDHILVDEAQDTNAHQWAIVASLAGEYFAEEADAASRLRTIFTVGDDKQAIFGFQGTDPAAFQAARLRFTQHAAQAGRSFRELALDRSFRSTPPILAVVDRLIAAVGHETLGLADAAEPHRSARAKLPGLVTLWPPVSADTGEAEDAGEEGWIDDATRALASRIAEQIAAWLKEPLWLDGKGRPLRPEDVLILVRKRGSLAALLVARLHAEGVPVAGVDRLRLDQPLAVKDLLAAIRFALQPEDDLNLANLLVSPLFGLTQDDLYRVGFRRPASLWRAVRDDVALAAVADDLGGLLAAADLTTPYRFLERILSGPLDGRRRLAGRLGLEARDPIEELLSAALAFEAEATPTLQRFLDWFDRGAVEVVRDPSAPLDAVRVMTVHGAKGLQAPLVILADATGDPELSPRRGVDWSLGEGEAVPIVSPRKAERGEALTETIEAAGRRERQEHWRLLYVAMTRAEERLVIAGALGPRAKGEPPRESWYRAVETALTELGATEAADPRWTMARHYAGERVAVRPRAAPRVAPSPVRVAVPDWLRRPAPQEARPPRPLAPSAPGPDESADPPPTPAMAAAARRGKLLHALFERLPSCPPEQRAAAAETWLAGSAGVADAAERRALAEAACGIIADPAFAAMFTADALAEAPIAAVVGDRVVSGTVDRLVVEPARVLVVDFKTGRRAPATIADAPIDHVRQMAAYVAALRVIFPGRAVEAALLYTAGPILLPVPEASIAAYKPGLAAAEQSLDDGG